MSKSQITIFFIALFQSAICQTSEKVSPTCNNENPSVTLTNIAFGSCFFQQVYSPVIFSQIQKKNPELYIALGDNIYADNYLEDYEGNPLENWESYIAMRYSQLGDSSLFKEFRSRVPVIAAWDDHDFGMNGSAGDFKHKQISKNAFFTFWNIPKQGKRWQQDGIYDSYYFGDAEHRVQIIVLDLRWNLDNPGAEPIAVITDTTKKMMSNKQWDWLKEELKKPAKIRIICSSTQFCTEHNGFEAWANFPHEQERMYKLLWTTKAEGAFFISGDVHLAEVNKRQPSGLYPIYDFTSSGLGLLAQEDNNRSNKFREGQSYKQNNFGTIQINWNEPVEISFTIFDQEGISLSQKKIKRSELTF